MPSPRVVSLIASATEMVYGLGMGHCLVGRSHECDYPPEVTRLPVCTSPKFPTDGTSYAIDQCVKAILQEGLSVYRVDADKLKELAPDVILTQTQCAVCAVSQHDVEEATVAWVGQRPLLVSLEPNCLADVWRDVQSVANALGSPEQGQAYVAELQARLHAITEWAKDVPYRPTVASIEWIDPLMASGNWMPELIERAGGVNLFGEHGKHSPWLAWEDLLRRDPEVLLLSPCGFDIPRTVSEMAVLEQKTDWYELRVVRGNRVYVLDGNQFFNRPGPRLVESLKILTEVLHPGLASCRWQGQAWMRWESTRGS